MFSNFFSVVGQLHSASSSVKISNKGFDFLVTRRLQFFQFKSDIVSLTLFKQPKYHLILFVSRLHFLQNLSLGSIFRIRQETSKSHIPKRTWLNWGVDRCLVAKRGERTCLGGLQQRSRYPTKPGTEDEKFPPSGFHSDNNRRSSSRVGKKIDGTQTGGWSRFPPLLPWPVFTFFFTWVFVFVDGRAPPLLVLASLRLTVRTEERARGVALQLAERALFRGSQHASKEKKHRQKI